VAALFALLSRSLPEKSEENHARSQS